MAKRINNKKLNPKLTLVENLTSLHSDAYQRIQTNIDLASVDKNVQVFAVTSPNPGDGKTTTASNLANIWAKKGKKVIIIDLDLHRNNVHNVFGIENRNGIVDYCSKDATLKDVIKKHGDLDIITAGKETIFPSIIMGSDILRNLIEELRKTYDYIVIDTAPILIINDILLLKDVVDGVIDVVALGITKRKELVKSIEILNDAKLNILGVIVTHDPVKKTYYKYKYEYGYSKTSKDQ